MIPTTNAALRNALIEAQAGLEFAAARLPQTTDFVPSHIAALKIVNAALTTAALPPEGWVMVPVEPTDKMVQAAHHIDLSYMPGQEGADRAAVYRAMLAAAPKAEPVTVAGIPATLPAGWVPLTITHDGQRPEEVAYGPLRKWLDRYFAMLTAPQPAIQQEPVAWANWKVGSTSYVPYRTREHAAASVRQSEIAATQEGPYEVVALYREPLQAAPAAQGDALDSDRLNWLEANAQITIERLRRIGSEKRVYEVASNDDEIYGEGDTLREAIDAARAAKEGA